MFCGLCIEVNCLYINNRKIIKLREYSKRTIFSCIAAVSLRCYSSRSQGKPEPPFILFPCKTIDVSCTPIWYEQLILVVQAKQWPLFLSTKAPINVLLKTINIFYKPRLLSEPFQQKTPAKSYIKCVQEIKFQLFQRAYPHYFWSFTMLLHFSLKEISPKFASTTTRKWS